jgi:sporulation protein YlmC with PRC-barrel domain
MTLIDSTPEDMLRASAAGSPVSDATARPAPADEPPRLMTASKMRGSKVINHQVETLGHIEDIVFDVPRGAVAYAAMASGGFLGLGERLFAVPWSALVYDAGRECFVLNAQKESFENAPGFDKDNWPTEVTTQWHDQVHRHYGAKPLDQRVD